VLLALGYTGPDYQLMQEQIGVGVDERGNIERSAGLRHLAPGVFVAGDAGRGPSLIVWAIAEGRAVAAEVDKYLEGDTSFRRR
jgi:glutamate synthase (NADPH/NADH) small chain